MKRREPSGEQRSSEARQGLRAQLSRAVGGSLDAIRSVLSTNPKGVDVSKQRLSDVLWNDRTLLATHESARAAPREEPRQLAGERAAEIEVDADAIEPEPDRSESPADAAGALLRAEARRSEVMRARLEATKARLATRLTGMPKGVAPIAPEAAPDVTAVAPEAAPDVTAVAPDVTGPATDESAAAWLTPLADAELTPEAIVADLAPPASPAPAPAEPPAPVLPEPPARSESAPPTAAAMQPEDEDAEDDGEEEPIRTRSMARLLASQGHRKRALKIYDALLAANGGDAELRAEADAVRRAG